LRRERAGLGADGGFLPRPVRLNRLLMGPAERADVIVDFTGIPVGTEIVLQNLGPDEPFGGGVPGIDFESSDPATTGLVMQFRVVAARSRDVSTAPQDLVLPSRAPLGPARIARQLSINEAESATVLVNAHAGHGHRAHQPAKLELACDNPDAVPFGPTHANLGTVTAEGEGHPLMWMDAVTENPALGATEIWELHNFHGGRTSDSRSPGAVRGRRTRGRAGHRPRPRSLGDRHQGYADRVPG
jgi:spore coat protein A